MGGKASQGAQTALGSSHRTLEVRGGQIPRGVVRISGAKNAATKLMAASLLTDGVVHLDNFPTELLDARNKADFLRELGVRVDFDSEADAVTIHAKEISPKRLGHYKYEFRTTYLLAAGQLQRNGIARIPYPGGCKIGSRGYDLHIMVWERMGCKVQELADHIAIECSKLQPADIKFPFPTVGGTENALLCAATIEGTTTVANAYITPEITNLITLLRNMGARIDVTGNSLIRVLGSSALRGTTQSVMSDRIEALTWIVFAALAQGDVTIEEVPFDCMEVPFIHLREAGVDVFRNETDVYVCPECFRKKTIQPFELACGTYPGIITDMQPFFVLLALKAHGISSVIDYRYPDRTAYLAELSKLCPGALEWSSGRIRVRGPATLRGAAVASTDLRGSMAVILAGLLSDGVTRVENVAMALRGYNNLLPKLSQLGIEYSLKEQARDLRTKS